MPTNVRNKDIESRHESEKKLLKLLGEELKQPLVAIAQLAELEQQPAIVEQARRALRTIDSVLLYERILSGQLQMQLEPVHVGSIVTDVVQAMQPMTRAHLCDVKVDIQTGLQPVDVDRRLLFTALQMLYQAFLDALPKNASIVCLANRTRTGIRLSLVSEQADLGSISLTSNEISTQPIAALSGPATDLITSRHMLSLFGARLSKTSTKFMSGFGMTLQPSQQLQIM